MSPVPGKIGTQSYGELVYTLVDESHARRPDPDLYSQWIQQAITASVDSVVGMSAMLLTSYQCMLVTGLL